MNEKFIKEIITATISGESHLGTNLKTQCLMYFDNLISENQQLKEQLERSEKARKEAIEFINKELEEIGKHQYAIGTRRLNKIKNILDIDKGE